MRLMIALIAMLFATAVYAQQTNPAADAVALQIGRLAVANAQLQGQVLALQQQVAAVTKVRDEAIAKCGVPCEAMKPKAPEKKG
jgi:hypothetical protein